MDHEEGGKGGKATMEMEQVRKRWWQQLHNDETSGVLAVMRRQSVT